MRIFRACLLVSLAGGVGCSDGPQGGTDVGNGRAQVDLDARGFEAEVSAKSLTFTDGARVDELFVAVDRIRLRPGSSCEGSDEEWDVEGPLVADLVAGGYVGGGVMFDVPAGAFCELRVRLHPVSPSDAVVPPGMEDLSVLARGVRGDGAPFVVESRQNAEHRLEAEGAAFELSTGDNPLFLGYDVAQWVSALALDTLGPGPIEVSDTQNADALDAFEEAVEESTALFRDLDGDGALSPSEQAAPLAQAD